ncbi:MAG: glycoside hydrolase family 29 [Bacteroidetes bacterium]|nr:MAG: glycoside hydrolase family 29 [Bacteroidota bacterium]
MRNKISFFLVVVLVLSLPACKTYSPGLVKPSSRQLAYQQLEQVGFIHFTVNTFTNKEWGYGDEDPAIFNPTELDAEQWVLAAKAGGLKELILTAKHHDGFCLWPSEYTEHCIKNSPYKDGKGDIVGEFVAACRKHGLKVGLYLSPWDRNHADYGSPAYIDYFRNQLRELLTRYGEINEIWFDGANGGDGYYGGANETREVDKKSYYDWPHTVALVKDLQPGIKIFSDAGPDLRWVGNEHGFAGETFWSTIDSSQLFIGASDPEYLNTGEPWGNCWIIGQCDVSIRPGWFYHADEDSLVKTPEELIDIYYKSVGRNAVLLLNLPPDRRGLIHETDVAHLATFRSILDETFAKDLAAGAELEESRTEDCHWIYDLILPGESAFDRIEIREDISKGQRVSRFRIELPSEGDWKTITSGTTIGYKRLLRTDLYSCRSLRLVIEDALAEPQGITISLYRSSEREP